MVRNFAGHFTCALSENDAEKLEYLDDLCETSYYQSNLDYCIGDFLEDGFLVFMFEQKTRKVY